uniref:Uncharacterized protein n=1 Tax=Anguilla anguilla TaxID=7936 RepID=A0A0E9W790_ANGAN
MIGHGICFAPVIGCFVVFTISGQNGLTLAIKVLVNQALCVNKFLFELELVWQFNQILNLINLIVAHIFTIFTSLTNFSALSSAELFSEMELDS